MIPIKPFKAYRPCNTLASSVAALPSDVLTSEEAKELVKQNPYSFLYVDKPEINEEAELEQNFGDLTALAGRKLQEMLDKKVFYQDKEECFYIYGLHNQWTSQYGLVCLLPCESYERAEIKKHEQTRVDKEMERIKHIAACKAHTGPIFLFYNEMQQMTECIEGYVASHQPIQSFVAADGVRHEVFKISDEQMQKKIKEAASSLETLYIADGHHRTAAACAYAKKLKEEGTATEETNNFLGVIFPKKHLNMLAYNRIVKDESGLTQTELFEKLTQKFEIEACKANYIPDRPNVFGMRYQQTWYKLSYKAADLEDVSVKDKLDVSILQKEVLSPIFGIEDPKTDARIDFVGGIKGIAELNRLSEEANELAFSFYPTSLEELMDIANANELMPPKSTWFEPKLRSGLFLHLFT